MRFARHYLKKVEKQPPQKIFAASRALL